MRIIAGSHRGRRLKAPRGTSVRPTADRVREALFNVLAHGREGGALLPAGARVLDLFAGTGGLGLEALSRGAAHVTFIENAPAALAALRTNIAALGVADCTTVLARDATAPGAAPTDAACALALLDPPYRSALAAPALEALAAGGWLMEGAVTAVELGASENVTPPEDFTRLEQRRWGAAKVVLLRWRS